MIDARDIPEGVQWHEGMLLTPQHFQLADRRMESLLGYQLRSAVPFCWGVARLSLDPSLLLTGIVRVTELEAILPDGTVVTYPGDDGPLLEVSLVAQREALRAAPVTVHLVVPSYATHAVAGQTRRWRSAEGAPVADDNTGEPGLPVPRRRINLALATSPAPTQPPHSRYVSLPLTVVALREENFALEPYSPPRLSVPLGTVLSDLCRRVAVGLRERAVALAERAQVAPAGADMVAGEAASTVRTLVGPLPRLEALLATQSVHPFLLYLTLCDTVGSLAVLGPQGVPPVPPAYCHDDALPAFQQLSDLLLAIVERVREPYRAMRFHTEGDGRFALALEPDWLQGDLIIGVRAAPGQATATVGEWMNSALIGTRGHLSDIRLHRIRGAERRRLDNVDSIGFLPPASMVLFAVTPSPDFVTGGDVLTILGARSRGDAVPSEVVLYLRRDAEGSTPDGPAIDSGAP